MWGSFSFLGASRGMVFCHDAFFLCSFVQSVMLMCFGRFCRALWHVACAVFVLPFRTANINTQQVKASHRWMVSGTPIAGKIDSLHGELNFLQVQHLS